MAGVIAGFTTVTFIILVGVALAHLKVADLNTQRVLATMTFYVASPALLITMLQDSEVGDLFSGNLIATGGAMLISAGTALTLSRLRGFDLGHTVITMLSSSYVNSANLGIPIAVYVIGDATGVAPTLLLQLVVMQPLALTLLDIAVAGEHLDLKQILLRPIKNPMTIGSVAGLIMALTGWRLPPQIFDPLDIIGGMSIPCMLIAYGISLRLGPLPGRGVPLGELIVTVSLKMVVQPLAAYLIGRYLLDLDALGLLTVTVISALPTAQNVFVMAMRYQRSVTLARDAVFVNTISAVPVMFVIAGLLA